MWRVLSTICLFKSGSSLKFSSGFSFFRMDGILFTRSCAHFPSEQLPCLLSFILQFTMCYKFSFCCFISPTKITIFKAKTVNYLTWSCIVSGPWRVLYQYLLFEWSFEVTLKSLLQAAFKRSMFIEGNCLKTIKAVYEKSSANITLNNEN